MLFYVFFIKGSKRILTADNFFSSINLANLLWEKKILYIGTIRKNKPGVPIEFFENKKREVGSSLYGFNKQLTLVSFVPKARKSVLLISTAHHQKNIDEKTKKPNIILDYNKKKCGVDVLDQLIENFTCRRKTNRWTFTFFMFLIDTLAYNSFVLYQIKNNLNFNKGMRQNSIEKLSCELIKPLIIERAAKFSSNDFRGAQQHVQEAISKCGISIDHFGESSEQPRVSQKRKRCYQCPRLDDKKHKSWCIKCENTVCNNHAFIYKSSLCCKCFESGELYK
jgi:hypothetical protein